MPVKFTFSSPLMKSWLLIHQSHRLLEKNEKKVFAQFGITPRKHAVLMAVKSLPAPLKVTDVAKWLDRNPTGISMLVDRMEKDGLIRKLPDKNDRRAIKLEITSKGETVYKESTKAIRKLYDDIFRRNFSEEELQTLCSLLEKVQRINLKIYAPERVNEELQILDV